MSPRKGDLRAVREIRIALKSSAYRYLLAGLDGWADLPCPELEGRGRGAVLVTDHTVRDLWSAEVLRALGRRGIEPRVISIPPGEPSKALETYERVVRETRDAGLLRDGLVLALGGGVVGDLAGFAAATYMRGVDWISLPTTLLSMADSGVGGKVGLDCAGEKNLIGAFHHPSLVLCAVGFLDTLPDVEFANGMAEVVKVALLGDPDLFAILEERADRIRARERSLLEEIIERGVRVKARIVERDPDERGDRRLLNLGHTIGHAIEAAGGYRRHRHGEAVAIGLVAACHLSTMLGVSDAAHRDRVTRLLQRYNLPIRCPETSWNDLKPHIAIDKKGTAAGRACVLTGGVGVASVHERVPEASVQEAAAFVLA